MLIIEKFEEIPFNNEAERQRILAAFDFGKLQTKLLDILTHFEKGELDEATSLVKTLAKTDWDYLHWHITDVLINHIKTQSGQHPKVKYRIQKG